MVDGWEGYEAAVEDQAPYVRRRTRLVEPDLEAWVYVWNGPLDALVAIPGGDRRARAPLASGTCTVVVAGDHP